MSESECCASGSCEVCNPCAHPELAAELRRQEAARHWLVLRAQHHDRDVFYPSNIPTPPPTIWAECYCGWKSEGCQNELRARALHAAHVKAIES